MPAVRLDLVLVAVKEVGPRVREDLPGDQRQGLLGQLVVVVQEGDVAPAGQGQGAVAGGRDAAADRAEGHRD